MEPFQFRGFTLIELLVVFAIIGIITGIVFTNQGTFNKTLLLSNTAYDIALSLRSAQTFGLGSRAVGSIANAGYGVHFQTSPSDSFFLFADTHSTAPMPCATPDCKPGDHAYTFGSDALIQTYALGNGIIVSDFCATRPGPTVACAYANGGGLTSLDIVFSRPNPDAFITANGSPYTDACLTITSPQGGFRYISVGSSGAITANVSSCP